MGSNEVRIDLVTKGAPATKRDLDLVGKAADQAGDELRGMAAEATALDKAVTSTEKNLAALRLELAASPTDKGLRKQVKAEERELNFLNRLKTAVTPAEAKSTGLEIGKHVTGGIGDAFGALPAQVKGAGIAIGAALAVGAAPALGATVAAAVLGGVGLGGIAGGIAAAAQDPAVKAAGERLGESLSSSFGRIGRPFAEPLIEQMGRLENIGGRAFGKIGADIAPLADHLDNIVDGVEGFADNLDLGKVAQAAGPIVDMIGAKLPDAADALTNSLDSMADGGAGAAHALGETFDALEGGIEITGRLVGELAKIEPYVTTGGAALLDLVDTFNDKDLPLGLAGWIEKLDQSGDAAIRARGPAKSYADALGDMGVAAEGATEKALRMSDAFDTVFGRQMALDEANAAYRQGLRDLNAELTEGEKTLKENTQEGHDNAAAVRDQLQVIEDLRKAQIDHGASVDVANAAYDTHIAKLRDTLLKLGYSKKAVDELIGAYASLPSDVQIQLRMPGLYQALQRMRELARLLGSNAAGRNAAEGSEPVSGRAGGGPVDPNRPYIVGEEGPELVTFGAAGMVHTAAQTRAMLSGSSGGTAAAAASGMTVDQVASAIRAALNGVAVVLDGRTVGQIQANDANLYARSF
jgi:hypothetical protein